MSWFRKAPLNTTGRIQSGNLVVSGQYSTNMPRPGGFSAHSDTAASLLSARVGGDGKLRVEEARDYVERLQAKVDRQMAAPAIQVTGRKASFLRAAARGLGSCLGVGLGSVRQAEPAWIRPDRTGPSVRSGRPQSAPVSQPAPDGTQLREAVQNRDRIDEFSQQITGVRNLLTVSLNEAQGKYDAALDEVQRCRQIHQESGQTRLEAEHHLQLLEQQCAATENELQQVSSELSQHEELLGGRRSKLQAAQRAQTIAASAGGSSLSSRAKRVLNSYNHLCARDQHALAQAQSQLQVLDARSASPAAKSAVISMVNELRSRLDKNLALRDRAQAQYDRVNQAIASGTLRSSVPSRGEARGQALRQRVDVLTQAHQRQQASLNEAALALSDARDHENVTDAHLQRALRTLDDARAQVAGLTQELDSLVPLQNEIDTRQQQALLEEETQRSAWAQIQNDRTEALLSQPAGFEPTAVHIDLSIELRELGERLNSRTVHTTDAAQWPLNDTLEVVSLALAKVSGGDSDLAAQALHELMQCNLTELVPQPGQWLDGSPRTVGVPPPMPTTLEKLVQELLDLPCGGELITRLVQPQAEPITALQRDAVSVYYKAMAAAMSPTLSDGDSWMWLHCAASAACQLAHPEVSSELSVQQRAAFHGVRNGFMSVEPGSSYDQASRYLQRWADHTVRDIHGINPFKTRREAATAATQVGLPTPLRQSNAEIRKSCSQLQQAITAHLIEARRLAHQQGQAVDIQALEPMLQASSLLRYIEKNADKFIRLDEMPIGRRAWRSVDKHTSRWIKREGTLASAPERLRAEVTQLGLAAPASLVRVATSNPVQMLDLQTGLAELRLDQGCTALQALEVIHAQLGDVANTALPPGGNSAARQPRERAAIERDDVIDTAEDEHQGRITQLAHDMCCLNVQQSLDKSRSLQPTVDAFMGKKMQWRSEELPNWLVPVIGEKSSAVTMKHGRSVGLSTLGLGVAVSQVIEKLGLSARLDAEFSKLDQEVFRYAKQSRGLEAIIGQNQEHRRRVGFAAGVGWSLLALPSEDGVAGSAVGTWSRSRLKSDTQGVLLRAPVYGEKRLPQARQTFSDMLNSVANWRSLTDEVSGERYDSALQAVLARHPDASVGTIEQLTVVGRGTRSGLSATVSGGGPFSKNALPSFFGSVGVGAGLGSERRTEDTQYKTQGGSQGFVGTTVDTTAIVSGNLTYAGHLGGVVRPGGRDGVALRARSSAAVLQVDLHRQQAQSSATVVRQPDGTLIGEKAMEFNTFEPFEAAIRKRWDDWIDHGVKKASWPESIPVATRRLLVEQELESFMRAAKSSVRQAGTVTLSETLEVRPEVCAELSACLALEELANAKGETDKVQAAAARRDQLLQAESSYFPYKLKAIVRSQIESGKGLNIAVFSQLKKSASASHEYDSFPKA